MAVQLALKVFLVIVYLAPGETNPTIGRAEMPTLDVCWVKAKQVLAQANKERHPIGTKYGVGCMMSGE